MPPLKKTNGSGLVESETEQAEEFNCQFTDVFTKTSESEVPLFEKSAPPKSDIHISNEGVIKMMKGLNPSKALGPDELHPRVLKELAVELGPVFAHLFQQSLDMGEIPKEWSLANICPLYKKCNRALPSNYRPVSLICVPSKMLEHIVCTKYYDTLMNTSFCKTGDMLSGRIVVVKLGQNFGCRRSSRNTLILDFEKAFDTPSDELLKCKLHA